MPVTAHRGSRSLNRGFPQQRQRHSFVHGNLFKGATGPDAYGIYVHLGPARGRRKGRHRFLRKPPRAGVRYVPLTSALMPIIAPDPSVITFPAGGSSGGYQVIVVNKLGARVALGELNNAQLARCSWRLNEAGEAGFALPTLDARAGTIVQLDNEVQIWRHGRLLWWGAIVRVEADAKRIDVQCRSLEWYLDRRFFGRADRTNLLTNPSFETGDLSGWSLVSDPFTCESTASTAIFIEGSWSAKLTSNVAQRDNYLTQTLDDYGATGVGSVLVLAGWYWIDPAGWLGEAIGKRGAVLRRLHPTTGAPLQTSVWDVDGDIDDGARGTWHRFEILVNMPPDAIEDIEVRLYSPGGTIHWDALSLTLMESVSSVSSPTDFTSDVADLFTMIIQHAQDPAFGKNDLNIGVSAALTGERVERHFQLAEHANIGESIRQFTEEGLFDWSIEIAPTTRTATLHHPSKGTTKPQFRVYMHGNASEGTTHSNVRDDFRFTFDGEQTANSIVVLGPGDGPDREEGGATNLALYGGNAYEYITQAPPEASINSLDGEANEKLNVLSQPEILQVTYVNVSRPGDIDYDVDRDPIDNLHIGDTVPVLIQYGWVQINEVAYRVISKDVDAERDLATFTFNRDTT